MKNLLKYFVGYRRYAVIGALAKLIEVIIQLFIPILFTLIIRDGLEARPAINMEAIWLYFGLICGCIVLSFGFSIFGQYFASKTGAGVAKNVRKAMYEKITTFSFSELDHFGVSSLNNRTTRDVSMLQDAINRTIRLILRVPTIIIGCLTILFIVYWAVGLVALIAVIIIGAILSVVMVLSYKYQKKIEESFDSLLKVTRENFRGARIVRAFVNEEYEEQRFIDRNKALGKTLMKLSKVHAIINPVVLIGINTALVLMYFFGALHVDPMNAAAGFDVATLPILTSFANELVLSLVATLEFILILGVGRSSWFRILQVLDIVPSIQNAENPVIPVFEKSPSIEFKKVSFIYNNEEACSIRDLSLKVAPGEFLGIVGVTGSGKTTLINLLPRFYDVTSGEILIDGVNIKDYEYHELRKRISYVAQIPDMLTGTIRSNLEFGNRFESNLFDEAIDISDSEDIIYVKHDHLDEKVLNGGKNFSLGQKQRLNLARALIRHNKVLILDDSLSALDTITDARIRAKLNGIANPPTTLIVSQRVNTLKELDRIMLMHNGSLSDIGTHEELIKRSKLYRMIVHSQEMGGK